MIPAMMGKVYDYAIFTLTNGQSDYDVAANQSTLFFNVPYAKHISLAFNRQIGLRINSTLMPKITLAINKNPFNSPDDFIEVSNLYLSNSSGVDATIEALIW